jgi:hypothetical protein
MLSDELIRELREIFREDYGLDISEADARKLAEWLARYFDALIDAARPSCIPEQKLTSSL